jgi:magnesium transporter
MAICIGATIAINMGVASFIGASLPVLFKSLDIDPAVASAPFISTTLDIIGQMIYFTIAIAMFNAML